MIMRTFKEITNEMLSLYERKNKDYGNSFGKTYEKLGIISAVVRLQDKMNRIIELTTKGEQQVNDESLRDTIIDMANYSVMTLMEMSKSEDVHADR